MIDPLQVSLKVAASGLEAQSKRLRVVSENLANANSTGAVPGAATPFKRRTGSRMSGKSAAGAGSQGARKLLAVLARFFIGSRYGCLRAPRAPGNKKGRP